MSGQPKSAFRFRSMIVQVGSSRLGCTLRGPLSRPPQDVETNAPYCSWSFTLSRPAAVIIDAGRTGNADAADHLSADLDRLPAGYGNDVQSPADAPLNLGLEASWRIRR